MMSPSQISLDLEIQRRARQRASDLDVSFAEYWQGLRDGVATIESVGTADPEAVFDLGNSGGSDIARDKRAMVAEAFAAARAKPRRP